MSYMSGSQTNKLFRSLSCDIVLMTLVSNQLLDHRCVVPQRVVHTEPSRCLIRCGGSALVITCSNRKRKRSDDQTTLRLLRFRNEHLFHLFETNTCSTWFHSPELHPHSSLPTIRRLSGTVSFFPAFSRKKRKTHRAISCQLWRHSNLQRGVIKPSCPAGNHAKLLNGMSK